MTNLEIKTIFKNFTTTDMYYITTNQNGQECIWKKSTKIMNGQEKQLQNRFFMGAEYHPELQTSEEIHQFLVEFLHKIEETEKQDIDPEDGYETIITFTEDDPEPEAPEGMTLVKVDRNGSKHYEGQITCPKCGGVGLIAHHVENGVPSWNWTDNGVCHKCKGSGKIFGKMIIRTPEYEAVLAERRRKKAEAKKAEHEAKIQQIRKEWLTNNGWTEDGFTFLFLGETYSKKDQIKEVGGRFNRQLGWYIDHEVEGFDFLKISKEGILDETYFGYMIDVEVNIDEMKRTEEARLHPEEHTSEYQGQVKERLKDLHLTVMFTTVFEGQQGRQGWNGRSYFMDDSRWFYSFKDEHGNIFTWTASNPAGIEILDDNGDQIGWKGLEKGDTCILTGTVKNHKEYKGDKQTVLTRCKVQGIA